MDDRDRRRLPRAGRARVSESFNERFWYEAGGYLYDVVDTDEAALAATIAKCRPNQVLAISLAAPGARPRALGTGHAHRRATAADAGRAAIAGARRSRLQAALLRRPARARRRLPPGHRLGLAGRPVRRRVAEGLSRTTRGRAPRRSRASSPHLDEACIGSISEVFDAEPPFTPRGCIAQAWSVAEVLRAWVKLSHREPSGTPLATDAVASGSSRT